MIRSYDARLEVSGDGREVVGRVVPLGEVGHIREVVNGELDEYDEEFLPGCTARMRQAAQMRGGPRWIKFSLDHEQGFDFNIGFCREIAEAAGGVEATFRLHDDAARLGKIRSMLTESHDGMSIEFTDVASPIVEGNLRRRRQIHITAVTATPIPVYASARVLSMRDDDHPLDVGTPNLDRVRALLSGAQ